MTVAANSSEFLKPFLGQSISDLIKNGHARKIAMDLKCGEGPAWLADRGFWIFSDIPGNRMFSYREEIGLQIFRSPSNFANGNFALLHGNVLTCEHLTRRVILTNRYGTSTVVCDQFDGKRLNSPNDVIADTAGNVWFTDPTYGILSNEEGRKADPEQSQNRVYRVDGRSGDVTAVVSDLSMPNGLCLSPNEDFLFVGDSGAEQGPEKGYNPAGPRCIFKYSVGQEWVLEPGTEFCRVSEGVPDGIRCDSDGNIWAATGAGIECYDANGNLTGVISTPYVATNLCFGGEKGTSLLLTTTDAAYLIKPV